MTAEHYFAYGSNLSTAELRAYCPSAQCLGLARLDGWQLAFTVYAAKRQGGVADIVPVGSELARPSSGDPADRPRALLSSAPTADGQPPAAPASLLSPVWGVLWSIPLEEVPALDAKEGYAPGRAEELNMYRRIELAVTLFIEPALLGGGDSPRLAMPGPPDPVPAFAYEVVHKSPEHVPPSRGYLDLVVSGAREQRLPEDYVSALAHTPATD